MTLTWTEAVRESLSIMVERAAVGIKAPIRLLLSRPHVMIVGRLRLVKDVP
jgi:hypothetical protein